MVPPGAVTLFVKTFVAAPKSRLVRGNLQSSISFVLIRKLTFFYFVQDEDTAKAIADASAKADLLTLWTEIQSELKPVIICILVNMNIISYYYSISWEFSVTSANSTFPLIKKEIEYLPRYLESEERKSC